jgi:hypothetical protein
MAVVMLIMYFSNLFFFLTDSGLILTPKETNENEKASYQGCCDVNNIVFLVPVLTDIALTFSPKETNIFAS